MDSVDRKIISMLGSDGRVPNREIARQIGVSEGTVRQRLSRLTESGAVRITAQINIESFPEMYLAFVGMKIDGRHLQDSAAEVEKLQAVITTMIVTGRYDLMAVVLAHSRHTLVDFVTDKLSEIPGVRDSETYVVLKNYGQWVPADKLGMLLENSAEQP